MRSQNTMIHSFCLFLCGSLCCEFAHWNHSSIAVASIFVGFVFVILSKDTMDTMTDPQCLMDLMVDIRCAVVVDHEEDIVEIEEEDGVVDLVRNTEGIGTVRNECRGTKVLTHRAFIGRKENDLFPMERFLILLPNSNRTDDRRIRRFCRRSKLGNEGDSYSKMLIDHHGVCTLSLCHFFISSFWVIFGSDWWMDC